MFGNFIEENCTGTGNTITLTGATQYGISFDEVYSNTDAVPYVIVDSNGINRVGGVGTYNTGGTITRNDSWSWNGTTYDASPASNITLTGGTHVIRVSPLASDFDDYARQSAANIFDEDQAVVKTSGTAQWILDTAATSFAGLRYRTGGLTRWFIGKNGDAESGGNAGSNLIITPYDDTGSSLGVTASINRATGEFTFLNQTNFNGAVRFDTDIYLNSFGDYIHYNNGSDVVGFGYTGTNFILGNSADNVVLRGRTADGHVYVSGTGDTNGATWKIRHEGNFVAGTDYQTPLSNVAFTNVNNNFSASQSVTGDFTLSGQLNLGNTTGFTLFGGSTFGSILEGVDNGHVAVRLRNNDNADSFGVIADSTNTGSATSDRVVFKVQADGNATILGSLDVNGTSIDANQINGTQIIASTYMRATSSSGGSGMYLDSTESWVSGTLYAPGLRWREADGTSIAGIRGYVSSSDEKILSLGVGWLTPVLAVHSNRIDVTGRADADEMRADIHAGATNPSNSFIDFDDDITTLSGGSNNTTLAGISHVQFLADSNNNGTGQFFWGAGDTDGTAADFIMSLSQAGTLALGRDENLRGQIQLKGDAGANGGLLRLENGATQQTYYQYHYIQPVDNTLDFRAYDGATFPTYLRLGMNSAGTAGIMQLGSNNTRYGSLAIFGDDNLQGGLMYLYNAANEDTDIGYHRIEANASSLLFRTADGADSNVTTAMSYTHVRSSDYCQLQAGSNGATAGYVVAGGNASTLGGRVMLYNGATVDTETDYWRLRADTSGNFVIEGVGGTASLGTLISFNRTNGETIFYYDVELQNVQRTSVTANVGRLGQHTIVETVATTNTTLTLVNEFSNLDVVDIHKQRTSGTLTITSANGNITIPNGASALSHTIEAGTAMSVRLFRTGSNTWSLSITGAAQNPA